MMAATTTPRLPLLGVEFDALTEDDVVQAVLDRSERGKGGWIATVNLDILRQTVDDPDLFAMVATAEFVVPDGMPLVWASRIAGQPFPERVAGSSLLLTIAAEAARRGRSIYLLGGNPGAAEAAAARLAEANPGLRVAGTACPPFGFEHDPAELASIAQDLERTRPDVVFVGLGFPKQDRLSVRLRERFPGMWFVSNGISFSFVSGEVKRAPAAIQRSGLEWLHRMLQEPRRLGPRYVKHGPGIFRRLIASAVRTRRERG